MNISKQYAWRSSRNSRENNHLFPQSLRGLVIGKSGCGKTTVIFNLLLQPGWLDYKHLYVFGKSLHQQECPQERFRGWIEQAENFQCVQQSRSAGLASHCH